MKIGKKLTVSHILMAIVPVVAIGIITIILVTSKFTQLDDVANKNGVKVITKKTDEEINKTTFEKLNAVQQIKKNQIQSHFVAVKKDLSILNNVLTTQGQEAYSKLKAVRQTKKESISRYLNSITDQITTFSKDQMIVDAMNDFSVAFQNNLTENNYPVEKIAEMKNDLNSYYINSFSKEYFTQTKNNASPADSWLKSLGDKAVAMQHQYIFANPNPLGSKDKLDQSNTVNSYSKLHHKLHPILRDYQQKFGYYDIFLVSLETGEVVYSVFKELDYATSLKNSPLATSGLGNAYRNAATLNSSDEFYIDDIKPYGPSYDAPAAFISAPIFDGTKKIGVLIFQMPLDRINNIMKENTGMGVSGETICIGQDGLMRSDSILDENFSVKNSFKNPNLYKISSKSARLAFEDKKDGHLWELDYRGNQTLSLYGPLNVGNLTWCLTAKIDVNEFYCTAQDRKVRESYFLSKFKTDGGYYDLFLIDPAGLCFYSVEQESDYNTNLLTGKYKDSGLGKLVKTVLGTKTFGFADFAPYAPSNGEPASFIAEPVLSPDGTVQVIVALQISLEAINKVMNERTGMGKSGETYLVGPDYLMRSDSFLDPAKHSVKSSFAHPEIGAVKTTGTIKALEGKEGNEIIKDYNGNKVLSSFSSLDVYGTKWAILAEIDEDEAFAVNKEIQNTSHTIEDKIVETKNDAVNLVTYVLLGLCVISGILAFFITRILAARITKPIIETVNLANAMAQGDLSKTIDVKTNDETGDLAKALNSTTQQLSQMIQQIQTHSNMLGSSSEELATISNQMVSGAKEMTQQSTNVASATEEMSTNINTMASAVEEMSTNTASVSSAAEQMSQNMSAVASAMEEMSSTINGIGQNSDEGKKIAAEAMEMAILATKTMNALGEAAKEIGQVTDTIKSIAEKTDLLALNATIEAASAGDAGKGFAVVANEIKGLASRSAQAAEDIANRIGGVQNNSKEAVTVIEKVSAVISKINASVMVITQSVAEQTKTCNEITANISEANTASVNIAESIGEIAKGTNDISKNAGEAAKGTNEVSSSIQGVNKAAKEANSGSQQVNTAAQELSTVAGELNKLVNKFKVSNNLGKLNG